MTYCGYPEQTVKLQNARIQRNATSQDLGVTILPCFHVPTIAINSRNEKIESRVRLAM